MNYSPKLLLALQYWDGDRSQALELARLIADLEPVHNKTADFLFVCRFDSTHSAETIKHVSRKFNTFSHVSKRKGVGWPFGCSELFFGMIEWFYHKKVAKQIPNYKAVLAFEADSAPLTKNWIESLHKEWDRVNKPKPCYMAGAMLTQPDHPHIKEHINGNAMMSGDPRFLNWLLTRTGISAGWDWILAPEFKQWGYSDVPGMRSLWRNEVSEAGLQAEIDRGTFFYHGCKSMELLNFARKKLC